MPAIRCQYQCSHSREELEASCRDNHRSRKSTRHPRTEQSLLLARSFRSTGEKHTLFQSEILLFVRGFALALIANRAIPSRATPEGDAFMPHIRTESNDICEVTDNHVEMQQLN